MVPRLLTIRQRARRVTARTAAVNRLAHGEGRAVSVMGILGVEEPRQSPRPRRVTASYHEHTTPLAEVPPSHRGRPCAAAGFCRCDMLPVRGMPSGMDAAAPGPRDDDRRERLEGLLFECLEARARGDTARLQALMPTDAAEAESLRQLLAITNDLQGD